MKYLVPNFDLTRLISSENINRFVTGYFMVKQYSIFMFQFHCHIFKMLCFKRWSNTAILSIAIAKVRWHKKIIHVIVVQCTLSLRHVSVTSLVIIN